MPRLWKEKKRERENRLLSTPDSQFNLWVCKDFNVERGRDEWEMRTEKKTEISDPLTEYKIGKYK